MFYPEGQAATLMVHHSMDSRPSKIPLQRIKRCMCIIIFENLCNRYPSVELLPPAAPNNFPTTSATACGHICHSSRVTKTPPPTSFSHFTSSLSPLSRYCRRVLLGVGADQAGDGGTMAGNPCTIPTAPDARAALRSLLVWGGGRWYCSARSPHRACH